MSTRFSSMDICTAKPASGFTLGRDSRSVERTKKFPWKVWMDRPRGGREGERERQRERERERDRERERERSELYLFNENKDNISQISPIPRVNTQDCNATRLGFPLLYRMQSVKSGDMQLLMTCKSLVY